MEDCCALRTNPYRDGRVVHETPNFFVTAALGSMDLPGYVLLVSKDHLIGTGDMPGELHRELEDLMGQTAGVLKAAYGKDTFFFEHGPRVGQCGWGGCIDHAHVHAIPGVDVTDLFAADLMERLDSDGLFYRVDRLEGFDRAAEIYNRRKTSYVMVQATKGRLFSEVNFPGQSQWLRRLVALRTGSPEWNWRLHPGKERALQTANELAGKFS